MVENSKWFVMGPYWSLRHTTVNKSLLFANKLNKHIRELEALFLFFGHVRKGIDDKRKGFDSSLAFPIKKRLHVSWFRSKRYRSVAALFLAMRNFVFIAPRALWKRQKSFEPIHLFVVRIINQPAKIFNSCSFQSASWFKCFGLFFFPVFFFVSFFKPRSLFTFDSFIEVFCLKRSVLSRHTGVELKRLEFK